ncbi:glutathione S-transferase family protein [Polyangium fumosum]|uniref:glutathione transferase n=1 Tax=Polyangium fumosum TaxID=889272 RepID=A0A4U1J1X0_9BACT|nr:glutathione S-transferase family protein [Polyangium fumosum]TKD00556.1 glutathione S-transferase family protein [Polyangium fumosum]TKD01083.1 glutathione S-transferase family protein [Polyangium fumosum]
MSQLTLISHELCPYVQRAAIVLAEKGVAFERIDIDLSNKPDWFLAISPLGKVPLLRVRDESGKDAVLFESLAICEYLEETQPGPKLHPEDPIERARDRAWFDLASGLLGDIWALETTKDAEVFEAKRKAIVSKVEILEGALSDGPYFRGRTFSMVDAVIASAFRYFEVIDAIRDTRVFEKAPRVRAWKAALAERPSVKGAVPANYPDKLRKFLAGYDAYLFRLAPEGA